jgi:hypothetical protein
LDSERRAILGGNVSRLFPRRFRSSRNVIWEERTMQSNFLKSTPAHEAGVLTNWTTPSKTDKKCLPAPSKTYGDIVGDYVAKDGNLHGFFLGPDGFKDISVSGHLNTIPVKISAEGVIVGCYHDTDTMGTMHGWVHNEDGLTVYSTPASMNNGITPRGDVAGFYTDLMTMRTHGYILSNGASTQVDFPGSTATRVWDLNPRREAVGFYVDPTTHVPRGFQYHRGQFTPIDIASAKSTLPFGINPEGDIVGAYTDQIGKTHGFLLTRGDHDRRDDEREDDE